MVQFWIEDVAEELCNVTMLLFQRRKKEQKLLNSIHIETTKKKIYTIMTQHLPE